MTAISRSNQTHFEESVRPAATDIPAASLRYDWLMAILSVITMLGVFLDGWAHNSFSGSIETFLTPWHAVLYGGVLLSGIALGIPYVLNVVKGYSWQRALPKGYMISLIGFFIFGTAGGFDFVWHSLFGFEADTEALLSPAHLLLALGAVLMMSGALRAAWMAGGKEDRQGWARLGPAILSLLAVLSIFTFFGQFANVITHAHNIVGQQPYSADRYVWQNSTVTYILIPAMILSGFMLFAIRRWKLPTGTFTFLFTANATLMFWESVRYNGENWPVLIGAVAGGIAADVLYNVLKPSVDRVRELRIFAFAVPFLYFLFVLISMIVTQGIWWRIHMWLGAPVLAGVIGLGMSMLLAPPTIPSEA